MGRRRAEIACWTLSLACAVQACSRGDDGVVGRGEDGPALVAPLAGDGEGGGTALGEGGYCEECFGEIYGEPFSKLCPCGQICVPLTVVPEGPSGVGGTDPGSDDTITLPKCYSSPPFCKRDGDCHAGQTCDEGLCSCSATSDCGTVAFVCAGGMCSGTRCTSNLGCADGLVCTVSGMCGARLASEGDPELSCTYRAAAGGAPAGALAALALAVAIGRRARRAQKV